MNLERARRAYAAVLPQVVAHGGGRARQAGQRSAEGHHIRSQTTVFAFHLADGLVLGGDRRTTGFHTEIASEDTVKIEQITTNSALLASGYVSSSQLIEDELKAAVRSFQAASEYEPSLEGQAKFASRLCAQGAWDQWLWSFEALLCGRDADGSYKILLLEEDGGRIPYAKFYATGSGWTVAKTILWRGWKAGMAREEGVRLGAEALVYAGLMDNGTSDFRAGVVPSLATVTDDGFAWVAPDRDRCGGESDVGRSAGAGGSAMTNIGNGSNEVGTYKFKLKTVEERLQNAYLVFVNAPNPDRQPKRMGYLVFGGPQPVHVRLFENFVVFVVAGTSSDIHEVDDYLDLFANEVRKDWSPSDFHARHAAGYMRNLLRLTHHYLGDMDMIAAELIFLDFQGRISAVRFDGDQEDLQLGSDRVVVWAGSHRKTVRRAITSIIGRHLPDATASTEEFTAAEDRLKAEYSDISNVLVRSVDIPE